MGSILMYELMAEERATRYREEAERDRWVALIEAQKRVPEAALQSSSPERAVTSASSAPSFSPAPSRLTPAATPISTRRALAAAFVGFATFGALRRRRVNEQR